MSSLEQMFASGAFDASKDGRTCRLDLSAEIVPLHRFDLPGAPVTAWRVGIHGEHIGPDAWRGPRRESRADAVRDLAELVGRAS